MHTKGKWEVEHNNYEGISIFCDSEQRQETIYIADINDMICDDDGNCLDSEIEGNAQLIVEAVNSCQEINPDNPLAVAESIKDMYEALKMLYRYSFIHPVEGVVYPEGTHKEWIKKANQALAKAEGKE